MPLKDLREEMHDAGYDKEAAYFRKQEKELLERLRKKKEAEEAEAKAKAEAEAEAEEKPG